MGLWCMESTDICYFYFRVGTELTAFAEECAHKNQFSETEADIPPPPHTHTHTNARIFPAVFHLVVSISEPILRSKFTV